LITTLLMACNDPDSADPKDLIGAKVTGDDSPPDIQLGANVVKADGTTIGDWTANPTTITPGDTINLQNDVQVLIGATATDNDGGAKSVRVYAFLDRRSCVGDDDTGTIGNGLGGDRPRAESTDKSQVEAGKQVLKSRVILYLLHSPGPVKGTPTKYCVEKWQVSAEAENYSGAKTRTKVLTVTFDTRPVAG
jgi:hypothetical protein